MSNFVITFGPIALALTLYCLPGIIGVNRDVVGSNWLWSLNMLLGWPVIVNRQNVFGANWLTLLDPLIDLTALGWVVLLIWAVAGQTKAADAYYRRVVSEPEQ